MTTRTKILNLIWHQIPTDKQGQDNPRLWHVPYRAWSVRDGSGAAGLGRTPAQALADLAVGRLTHALWIGKYTRFLGRFLARYVKEDTMELLPVAATGLFVGAVLFALLMDARARIKHLEARLDYAEDAALQAGVNLQAHLDQSAGRRAYTPSPIDQEQLRPWRPDDRRR